MKDDKRFRFKPEVTFVYHVVSLPPESRVSARSRAGGRNPKQPLVVLIFGHVQPRRWREELRAPPPPTPPPPPHRLDLIEVHREKKNGSDTSCAFQPRWQAYQEEIRNCNGSRGWEWGVVGGVSQDKYSTG